ncbi:PadR family transcriptional regulator [Dactylosporangium sp. AC04546]|uniref:PadR family transcriptional regulator n=1 Tax=Dactylosporangium sp. AC04546 TaxID=2862460 RepID=UPI001EDFBEC9|nr:PadR family transcriptional regulator [Dactylosporangium sp. AC04546]WVK83240.1 PadR family transcriptional regulator [Dactylosporangium sp. AC04546]
MTERVTQPTLDVLEALLVAHDFELHGWAIIKSTKRAGPTVYKILERLTKGGMLTERWEELGPEDNRPRRRFYRLTPTGIAYGRQLLAERRPEARQRWRPLLGGEAHA